MERIDLAAAQAHCVKMGLIHMSDKGLRSKICDAIIGWGEFKEIGLTPEKIAALKAASAVALARTIYATAMTVQMCKLLLMGILGMAFTSPRGSGESKGERVMNEYMLMKRSKTR